MILCSSGNLDDAKRLLVRKPNTNIQIYDNYAFRWTCRNGHLKIAQWLSEKIILTKKQKNLSFAWACEQGQIHISKWLLGKYNINITAFNNYGFVWACINNHLETVQWLLDKHNFIVDDFTTNFMKTMNSNDVLTWLNL